MGTIIDCKKIAMEYRSEIAQFIKDRKEKGLSAPSIGTIIANNDGGSLFYINNLHKLCDTLGIDWKQYSFNYESDEDKIIERINMLNNDSSINGIMLMLPLPKGMDEKKIISSIDYKKDLDGLTDINIGKLNKGENCFIPGTPNGVINIIKSTGINIKGKNAVIVGRSNIVGKPVAQLLLKEDATVTICHSKSVNLSKICSNADILISAIGKPNFINSNFVKEGAIVIDVGTSEVDGKICGDVNFDEVSTKVSFITKVPGGVGLLTTTMLLKNLCEGLK